MKILSKIIAINVLFLVFFNAQAATVLTGKVVYTSSYDGVSHSSGTIYTSNNSTGTYDDGTEFAKYSTTWGESGVKDTDVLLASDSLGSSNPEGEKDFFTAATGLDVSSYQKTNMENFAPNVFRDTDTGLSSLSVSGFNGGYFLLKMGGNATRTGNDTDFIFKNLPSLDSLVWLTSISDKSPDKNGGVLSLSHFGLISSVSEVPLPAAVWLFGSAFAGLMGFFRKRTKVA